MVAYTLHRSEESESFELRRWSTTELPESLEREFPPSDDPASLVLADDLSYFALRFLDESGEWKDRWDSTQLVESGELPIAVEIEVGARAARSGRCGRGRADRRAEPLRAAGRAAAAPDRPRGAARSRRRRRRRRAEDEDEEGGEGRTVAAVRRRLEARMRGIGGLSESDLAALKAARREHPGRGRSRPTPPRSRATPR